MSDDALRMSDVPDLTWRMAPVVAGRDESGLLVLLPGVDASGSIWEPTVAAMRRLGAPVRILSVHFGGTGAAPSVSALARAVVEVVDRVGGGRFWVAGVDLGGRVALELAADHPERVRGVGVFGSDPGAEGPSVGRREGLDRIRVPVIVVTGDADDAASARDLADLAEALPLGDSGTVPGASRLAPIERAPESATLLGELVGAVVAVR
jgi:pimeloyl-ACP methyl ester carboxylesterase